MTSTTALLGTVQAYLGAVAKGLQPQLDSGSVESVDSLHTALNAARHDIDVQMNSMVLAVEHRLSDLRAARAVHTLHAAADLLKSGALTLADIAACAGIALPFAAVPAPTESAPAAVTAVVVDAPVPQPEAPAAESSPVEAAATQAAAPVDIAATVSPSTSGYRKGAKYMDPASGRVWTGMGPCPKWLKALFVDGKTLADFVVQQAGPVASAEDGAAEVDSKPAEAASGAQQPGIEAAAAEGTAGADIGAVGTFDASDFRTDDIDGGALPSDGDHDFGEMLSGLDKLPVGLGDAGNEACFVAQ